MPIFKDGDTFFALSSGFLAFFPDGDKVLISPSGFLAFFPDGIPGRFGKCWCRNPRILRILVPPFRYASHTVGPLPLMKRGRYRFLAPTLPEALYYYNCSFFVSLES